MVFCGRYFFPASCLRVTLIDVQETHDIPCACIINAFNMAVLYRISKLGCNESHVTRVRAWVVLCVLINYS